MCLLQVDGVHTEGSALGAAEIASEMATSLTGFCGPAEGHPWRGLLACWSPLLADEQQIVWPCSWTRSRQRSVLSGAGSR